MALATELVSQMTNSMPFGRDDAVVSPIQTILYVGKNLYDFSKHFIEEGDVKTHIASRGSSIFL